MVDTTLKTVNKPRFQSSKDMLNSPNSVRAWRESPSSVSVQFRREYKYATVSLSFTEAKAFANAILEAVEDH